MNICDQLLCLCAQEGNTFCSQLDPKLFNNDSNHIEHKVFFTELMNLVESDDATLLKYPCYKATTNLDPLRRSAMRELLLDNALLTCFTESWRMFCCRCGGGVPLLPRRAQEGVRRDVQVAAVEQR